MTAATGPEDEPTPVAQHRAPGSVVLAMGTSDDALAKSLVSPGGAPSGSWEYPQVEVLTSPAVARHVLVLLERHAITSVNPDELDDVIEKITETAGIETEQWWKRHVFSPVQVFGEIIDRRKTYDESVMAVSGSGKVVAPLEWSRDLPASSMPGNFPPLHGESLPRAAAGTPVGSELLTVARVLRWLVRVWTEIEQVTGRRSYVQNEHGKVEVFLRRGSPAGRQDCADRNHAARTRRDQGRRCRRRPSSHDLGQQKRPESWPRLTPTPYQGSARTHVRSECPLLTKLRSSELCVGCRFCT